MFIMEEKDNKNEIDIEQSLHEDLCQYLLSVGKIDERLPEAPDIEGLWSKIGKSYLEDGIRELNAYPTASIGWMMFVGMALAKYWDTDWELYSKVPDLYKYLRDQRGYDEMDEYICDTVLLLSPEEQETVTKIVGECAARSYSMLCRQRYEAESEAAYRGYIAAIHQMYIMGMCVELKRLGYHMVKLS